MACGVLSDSEPLGWSEMTGWSTEPRSARGVSEDRQREEQNPRACLGQVGV